MNLLLNIYKRCLKALLLLAVLLSTVISGYAQLDNTHYIPPMYGKEDLGTHYLVLGTPIATTFNVTVKDGAGNLITTIPISSSSSSTYQLGSELNSPFVVSSSELNTPISNGKGLVLTASEPFYASIRVTVSAQAGSLTSKGALAAAGQDFRTGHMYNNAGYIDGKSNCFSFMATEDNTTVNVSDINTGVVFMGASSSGSPVTADDITVTLNAGESYVVAAAMNSSSATNNTNGMNGTHITSDKDIVVNCGSWLAGNCRDGINPTDPACSGRDIGIDQIVSIDEIGDEYVLIKGFGVDNERVVIVAAEDNTEIFLNGSATPTATLNAGDVHYLEGTAFSANDNLYINSSQPIYVTQTLNGGDGMSDDTERQGGINFLPPVRCTGSKEVTIPDVGFIGTPYISIIADAGATVQVNGSSLGSGTSVPGTADYVTYQVSGYSGDVTVSSDQRIRVALLNLNGNIGAAGYFSGFSKDVNIEAAYQNNGVGANEEIAEGCGLATITVNRSSLNADIAETFNLDIQGSAILGTDYTNIPNQLTFGVGVTQLSFDIAAFEDGLVEGDETVVIKLSLDGQACGADEIEFIIKDVQELSVNLSDSNVLCPGDDITLDAIVTGGAEPYQYTWSNATTNSSITVTPAATASYTVTVTDVCEQDTVSATALVEVPLYDLQIFHTNDTSVLCPYTELILSAEGTGGLAAYSYQWYLNGIYILNGPMLLTSPATSSTYTVTVSDQCGLVSSETVHTNVETPLMELTPSSATICPYESTDISVSINGGLPPFSYVWQHSGETTPSVSVNPGWTTSYPVEVMDACATYSLTTSPLVTVVKPNASFYVLSETQMENLPIFFGNNSSGAVSYEWDLGNGDFSTEFAPGTIYTDDGIYEVTLVATNDIGCTDTAVKEIRIKPEFFFYAPNAFTPNSDSYNNYYQVSVVGAKEFLFEIYNRWGERIYATSDGYFQWDGTYKGVQIQDGTLIWKSRIVSEDDEVHEFSGHLTILK